MASVSYPSACYSPSRALPATVPATSCSFPRQSRPQLTSRVHEALSVKPLLQRQQRRRASLANYPSGVSSDQADVSSGVARQPLVPSPPPAASPPLSAPPHFSSPLRVSRSPLSSNCRERMAGRLAAVTAAAAAAAVTAAAGSGSHHAAVAAAVTAAAGTHHHAAAAVVAPFDSSTVPPAVAAMMSAVLQGIEEAIGAELRERGGRMNTGNTSGDGDATAASASLAAADVAAAAAAGEAPVSGVASAGSSNTGGLLKHFEGPDGKSTGAILMRAGKAAEDPSSHGARKVDRLLASWLHCPLPMASLAFATLTVLMGPATDTPHLLFEFILSGPPVDHSAAATLHHSGSAAAAAVAASASADDTGAEGTAAAHAPAISTVFNRLTVVMDVIARRDLVTDAEYRHRVYESSQLAQLWAQCAKDQRFEPFSPATLFLRAALSPTALLFTLKPTETTSNSSSRAHADTSPSKARSGSEKQPAPGAPAQQQSGISHESSTTADWLSETVEEAVCPLAKDVLASWLDAASKAKAVEDEDEQQALVARDKAIVEFGIEVDLTSNLPRLFGQGITDEIVNAFRNL